MRTLITSLFVLVLSTFALGQKMELKEGVDLTFQAESLDLGDVKKGEKRTFKYEFTNTGTDTIEISIVSGCDCTTLDWTRGKIKSGETGIIDVIFDSTTKEESEVIDVDLYLKNINPISDSSYLIVLDYTYNLIK